MIRLDRRAGTDAGSGTETEKMPAVQYPRIIGLELGKDDNISN